MLVNETRSAKHPSVRVNFLIITFPFSMGTGDWIQLQAPLNSFRRTGRGQPGFQLVQVTFHEITFAISHIEKRLPRHLFAAARPPSIT